MVFSTVGWPGALIAKRSSRFLYSIHSFCCANAACAISSTHAAATSRNLCIDPVLRPLPPAPRRVVHYLRSIFAGRSNTTRVGVRPVSVSIQLHHRPLTSTRRYTRGAQHAESGVESDGLGHGKLVYHGSAVERTMTVKSLIASVAL